MGQRWNVARERTANPVISGIVGETSPLSSLPCRIGNCAPPSQGQFCLVLLKKGELAAETERLIHRFVIAGLAACFAVHEAVGAQADAKLRLAERTEFVTGTTPFGLLALRAQDPARGWLR